MAQLSLIYATAIIGLLFASLYPLSSLAFAPPLSSLQLPKGRSHNNSQIKIKSSTQLFHHQNHSQNHHHNDRRTFISSLVSSLSIVSSSRAAHAITPEQASKSYDNYAATYDNLDGGSIASSLGIDDARKSLVSKARGHVLEIGVGTGLNLESYNFNDSSIKSVTCVDISDGMLNQAKARIQQMKSTGIIKDDSISIEFVKADATSELISMFGENKFDTVIDTFSLCVMGNEGAKRCLDELAGVVKKAEDGGELSLISVGSYYIIHRANGCSYAQYVFTGQVLLIENTRASNPLLGYYQDATASTAADVGGKGMLLICDCYVLLI